MRLRLLSAARRNDLSYVIFDRETLVYQKFAIAGTRSPARGTRALPRDDGWRRLTFDVMFSQLSDKLQDVFKELRGHGTISESNVDTALRHVRLALLEADVDFQVAKKFIARIKEKALGEAVLRSITPGQQIVKIFYDELTALLGGDAAPVNLGDTGRVLIVGLNGSGKTTSSAKLGRLLKKQGRTPVLIACDLQRPAAIEQLVTLGKQIDIPVFTPEPGEKNVERAAAHTSARARQPGAPVVEIFDQFEVFVPERLAGRILGMGDVVSLVEKAAEAVDEEEAARLERKLRTASFDFNDFLAQFKMMQRMGPLENILGMLPGMSNVQGLSVDEKQLKRTEAIVLSMTNEERTRPDILNARRRQRIARGSGCTVTEVNDLLRRFDQMRKMMKSTGKMKKMMAQLARMRS